MSEKVSFKMSTDKDVSDIRKSLSALIIIMKCLGLYFDAEEDKTVSDRDSEVDTCIKSGKRVLTSWRVKYQSPSKKRCLFLVNGVYVVVVFLLLLANVARLIYSIVKNREFLALQIAFLVWYLHNVACVTCLFYACGSKGQLRKFYKKWRDFFNDPETQELGLKPGTCRVLMTLMSVLCTILLLFMVCGVTSALFLNDMAIKQTVISPFPVRSVYIMMAVVLHAWNLAVQIVSLIFVVYVNSYISNTFGGLSRLLHLQIKQANGKIPTNLKMIRVCHMKLCDVFSSYNKFLNIYLALAYVVTIGESCLTLYYLVMYTVPLITLVLNILWLIFSLSVGCIMSISCSRLHDKAHSPLTKLHLIRETENLGSSQAIQLQLFISKLTDTTIGASVLGIFVITKQALVTIVGAYVTYFLLLIQFEV